MPYTNIHWVKLKLEILNDKRFIFDCNETQRFMFLGLLLLAGTTKNDIPDDENYLKNRLNLSISPEKVRENLNFILSVFPKTVSKNGFIKFKNFNELHNQIRDSQRIATGEPKDPVEKRRIEKIREEYIRVKNWSLENYTNYGRDDRAIKGLLLKAKDDNLVLKALDWISKQNYEWTLETLLRKWPDFMAKDKKSIPTDHTLLCGNCRYLKDPVEGRSGRICAENDKILTASSTACKLFEKQC